MLIDKRKFTSEFGNQLDEFLIQCERCNKQMWLRGTKCNFGKKKYCSVKCINKGRVHSEEFKIKISKATSGANNPFFGKHHTEDNKIKCREAGRNALKIKKDKLGNSYDKWYTEYCKSLSKPGKQNPFYGKSHSANARTKMSEIKTKQISEGTLVCKNFNRGIKGWYLSSKTHEYFYYDSFYEFLRMKILDKDKFIITWTKRHKIKIPYTYKEISRYYVPDFLIDYDGYKVLEEVKGYEEAIKKQAKILSLKEYALSNNYRSRIIDRKTLNNMCLDIFQYSIRNLRDKFKAGEFK